MRTSFVVLSLILAATLASACAWVESVEATFMSQNGFVIPGGTMTVTYQRNVANMTDATASAVSGPDGVARLTLCDDAPEPIITDYYVTVTAPYGGTAQSRHETYSQARNGTNRLAFGFPVTVYNMSVQARDELGSPLAGANISVSGPYSRTAVANSSGEAWFMLPPGSYTVSASLGSINASTRVNLTYPMSVAVGPPPPLNNTLEVVVSDDFGVPLQNFTVALAFAGHSEEALTNESGAAEFAGLNATEALINISSNGTAFYTSNVTLQPLTSLNVTIDLHPPNITAVSVSSHNIGVYGTDTYEIQFKANVTDAVSPRERLSVGLEYVIGTDKFDTPLVYAGNSTFTAKTARAQQAPFSVFYRINATDERGNTASTNLTEFVVRHSAPPMTPTPIPGTYPTPSPENVTSNIPEPLRGVAGSVEGLLSGVSTYMWVMVLLVVVILGGTLFVFLAVNAFFYMKGGRKKKEA